MENKKRINLKLFRIEHELTQEDMAQRCGLDRSSYSLIEAGQREGRLKFWRKLQETFNIPDENMFKLMK